MAFKKLINIDVDASQAIKSLDELGGSFEDANEEGAIPLSTTIGELEDRLYAMAAAGDTSSKQFKEISGQVGKMKKVIVDTDMAVDGLSQTMAQNVGGALQGVASGFELAQGAMGTFGAGGEAVEEALLKVQSAMAISQGLQGIRESIASFQALRKVVMSNVVVQKLLNFVMKMNPIGLIIIAVTALGAAIALLWEPIQKVGEFFTGVTEKLGMFGKLLKWTLAVVFLPFVLAVKGIMMTLQALGVVESDEARASKVRHRKRIKQVEERLAKEKELKEELKRAHENEQRNLQRIIDLAAAQGKDVTKLTKQKIRDSIAYQKQQVKEIENWIKGLEFLAKTNKAFSEQFEAGKKKQEEFLNETKNSILDAEKDLLVIDANVKSKNASAHKTHLEEKLAESRRIRDLEIEAIKDDEERAVAARKEIFKRAIEDLKATGAERDKIIKLEEEKLQRELIDIKQSFREPNLEILNAEVLDNQVKNKRILEDDKETAKQKEAIAKEESKAKRKEAALQAESSIGGLQMVADFALVIAGKNERARKAAFNIQKAASIAQATVDTYKNATAAFGSFANIPVVGVPLGIAAAGAAVAAGLANIRSIASTQFEGSGAGTPAVPSLGGTGSGGSNPAQFNVVGNTGVNQLAEGLGGQEKITKTYVVSGDVTTAQSLDRNKIDTATL